MYAAVLNKPFMGFHAATYHAGQVQAGYVGFHSFGIVSRGAQCIGRNAYFTCL